MIYVTRGIIVQDGCILAAQRPETMSLPFKWELPGGKCEMDENPVDCLARETMEEIGLEISIREELPFVDREFRNKHYRMLPFICEVEGGVMYPYEHEQVCWWPIDRIWELDWGPAEKMLLEKWVGENTTTLKALRERVPA